MTDILKKLASRKGFVDEFWTRLKQYRAGGMNVTHIEVFNELNDLWETEIGEPRFPSYNAFRKYRDKK